jgi:type I restriction enzyme M protein
MKEIKKADILTIETLKLKIWSMFDILRSESISSEDYHVLLYLLSAYKDGIFNLDIFSEPRDLKEMLKRDLHKIEPNLAKQYLSIINFYEPIVSRLSLSCLNHIVKSLSELDSRILHEHFPEIFDSILFRIAQSQGRFGGQFVQPIELTRLIWNLAELETNSKIYNPFAGLASFSVFIEKNQNYFGQELNQKSWALGTLRVMAYGISTLSKYVCDDSILNWPSNSDKFDLIVATPPFRMRLSNDYRELNPEIRTIEHFLIEKGIGSLNQQGKLIAILPQSILFRGSHEYRLRKLLVNEDIIDTIISLPGGLLYNTGIPLVILILNKSKRNPGKIRFIDAKKFVEIKSHREKILKDKELYKFMLGNENDSDVIRFISNEQISEFDYNLHSPRYFQKKIEGVKLGEILEFVRDRGTNQAITGKLISIRDLKDDKINFRLDETSIQDDVIARPFYSQIKESCILLAIRWKTLKPTFFEYKGDAIYLSNDILSFKVNESIIDTAYLINELHTDYVLEQLDSYRLGEFTPFLRRDDLMEVIVKLPSLEEQRAKVQGIHELSDKIKKLQDEINALAHGKSINQFNEFASLKHTLGTPRQNILSYAEILISFFEKYSIEETAKFNKSFKEKTGTELISIFHSIKHDINFISEILEKGENGLILKDYELSVVPLDAVLKFVQQLCENHNYNFVSSPPTKINDLGGEKANSIGIRLNLFLLKILFDNIFSNAHKYAFEKKPFSTDHSVVIELGIAEEGFFINILNNGTSFPKNMDKEKFITKYKTSDVNNGTGLGGYDINRIAEYFESEWFLRLNSDPFFKVQFNFWFNPLPIK